MPTYRLYEYENTRFVVTSGDLNLKNQKLLKIFDYQGKLKNPNVFYFYLHYISDSKTLLSEPFTSRAKTAQDARAKGIKLGKTGRIITASNETSKPPATCKDCGCDHSIEICKKTKKQGPIGMLAKLVKSNADDNKSHYKKSAEIIASLRNKSKKCVCVSKCFNEMRDIVEDVVAYQDVGEGTEPSSDVLKLYETDPGIFGQILAICFE